MRATVMYGAFDVRVEDVPDAQLVEPTDAARLRHTRRDLRQRPLAVQVDGAERDRPTHGARVRGSRRGRRRRGSLGQARRFRDLAVPLVRRHLRLLPRGPADLVPARRAVRRPGRRRRPGRSRSRAAGRRDAGRPGVEAERRAAAVAPDADRRDVDRSPRGAGGAGRPGQDGRGRRRRGGRALRRDRVEAARRRAGDPPRPAPRADRARPRVRRRRGRRGARRGGGRARAAS